MEKRDPYEELHDAWAEFVRAVGEVLYIYKILDWLTERLERRKR